MDDAKSNAGLQPHETYLAETEKRHSRAMAEWPSLHIPSLDLYVSSLHTLLRAAETPSATFASTLRQLISILLTRSFHLLDYTPHTVVTPTASFFPGCCLHCPSIVSILRAGDAFVTPLSTLLPSSPIGKILIQRDESSPDKAARLIYAKLPGKVAWGGTVCVVDVMLASGGSMELAVEELLKIGVALEKLLVIVVIGTETGVRRLMDRWKGLRVVCQWLDEGLNEQCYILPGLGDAGDRYFGT